MILKTGASAQGQSIGAWTGGVSGYRTFHVFSFEFPRLQTGELKHSIESVITIEVIKCPLLSYVFCTESKSWYQYQLVQPGKNRFNVSWRFQELKGHQVPAVIKTHALLLELA